MKEYGQLVLLIFCILGMISYFYIRKTRAITSQQAMEIALKSDEVQAFMSADNGRFASCAKRRVVRPCDSGWVTCLEDGWVVEFFVGDECGVAHDGRLDLHLVIDWKGNIISCFPEKGYYQDSQYCIEDQECLSRISSGGEVCRNFVYGQIEDGSLPGHDECRCVKQKCVL